mmetsp:Transcript_19087/g.39312  ORF Transcript_19087/g.39312 Transcript_19087/m.39312 type:complete len:292 (-) Transcript_19087:2621-3496(-)
MDELGEVLDRVNVVMGRGRDEGDALLTRAEAGDVLGDLRTGELASLPGLGALGHLDLELLRGDEVLGGDAEAARGDLVDEAVGRVPVLEAVQVREGGGLAVLADVVDGLASDDVLPALAAVALAADPVHGDGEGLVRLPGEGSEGHGAAAEPLHDALDGLHLVDADGPTVRAEVHEVSDVRKRRLVEALLEDFVVGGVLAGIFGVLLLPLISNGGLVEADGVVQEAGEVCGVRVVLSRLGNGLVVAVVLDLFRVRDGLWAHHGGLRGDLLDRHSSDAAGGALEGQVDDVAA